MIDPTRITVDGWVSWQLLTPSGLIVREAEQHNLMLNQGLDLIAQHAFSGLPRYAALGTGSSAPAVAQTALDSEQARTQDSPGGDTITEVSPGVFDIIRVREFTEAVVGNFTEWGFSPTGAGNLAIRELFRDANGNPVVISKGSDQRLRLTYTLRVTIGPVTWAPGAFQISRAGSPVLNITGRGLLLAGYSYGWVEQLITGSGWYHAGFGGDYAGLSYSSGQSRRQAQDTSGTVQPAAYTPGSYSRAGAQITWSTSRAVGTWGSFLCNGNGGDDNYNGMSYVFDFDDGVTLTKTDLQSLTLTGPGISWARA